jgi:hypothetical protein
MQLQRFSAELAMSRGLDIANGLQKKSTTAGVHRLDVVFCNSPLVSGRKAYILHQGIVVLSLFLFRGRYSGHGLSEDSLVPTPNFFVRAGVESLMRERVPPK